MSTELTYEEKAMAEYCARNLCAAPTSTQTMPTQSGKTYRVKPYTPPVFDPGKQIQLGDHVFDSAQLGDLLAILLDQHPELKI